MILDNTLQAGKRQLYTDRMLTRVKQARIILCSNIYALLRGHICSEGTFLSPPCRYYARIVSYPRVFFLPWYLL